MARLPVSAMWNSVLPEEPSTEPSGGRPSNTAIVPSAVDLLHSPRRLIEDGETSSPTARFPPVRPGKRCSIPLFVGFFAALGSIGVLFLVLGWLLLHASAVRSIDQMGDRLHRLTELHLRDKVDSWLDQMVVTAQMAQTTLAGSLSDAKGVLEVRTLLPQLLLASMHPSDIVVAKPDGFMVVASRDGSGRISYGERPPDCVNQQCSNNITIWLLSSASPGYNESQEYLVFYVGPFDPRTRVWYKLVETGRRAMFTPPYSHYLTDTTGISYSIPLMGPDGTFEGVVGVSYFFTELTSSLVATQRAIDPSGVLLLVDGNDGAFLASTNKAPPSQADSTRLMKLPIPFSSSPDVSFITLDEFGASYVLNLCINRDSNGLNWRVFLIIPRDAYFSILNDQKVFAVSLCVSCVVAYCIIVAILVRFFLDMPLRKLTNRLLSLKEQLTCHRQSMDGIGMLDFSRFVELAKLQTAVTDLIRAVEDAVEQRARELLRVNETEHAHDEMQRIMRGKEIFFAMMSHELRTPLTACIGMAEILLGTSPLTSEQKECADAIAFSSDMMLGIVNNILVQAFNEIGPLFSQL